MRRLLTCLLFAASLGGNATAQVAPATVFAAASLQDAMRALGHTWAARGHPAPRLSFAASSALARQIEAGAPADLFASADELWMDYVAQRDLILPGSRMSPLGNRLVLVGPRNAASLTLTPDRGAALAERLGPGRLAVGDPAHVPAGRYAEAALRWLGAWDVLHPRLARAENVRAALLLVERGEAPLGIVYATDAAAVAGVGVVGTFPPESHPPISYPFALTRRAAGNAEANALLAFLVEAEAAPTWRRFGFNLRDQP